MVPPGTFLVDNLRLWLAKLTEQEFMHYEIWPYAHKPLYLNFKKLTPISILSGPDFDATQINPATVTLAGAMAKTHRGRTKFKIKDTNRDRLEDLVVYINTMYAKVDLRTSQALVTGRTWMATMFRARQPSRCRSAESRSTL